MGPRTSDTARMTSRRHIQLDEQQSLDRSRRPYENRQSRGVTKPDHPAHRFRMAMGTGMESLAVRIGKQEKPLSLADRIDKTDTLASRKKRKKALASIAKLETPAEDKPETPVSSRNLVSRTIPDDTPNPHIMFNRMFQAGGVPSKKRTYGVRITERPRSERTVSITSTVSDTLTDLNTYTEHADNPAFIPYTWEERDMILSYAELRLEEHRCDIKVWKSFSELFLHYRTPEEYQAWYKQNAIPAEARALKSVIVPRYSCKKARIFIDYIKEEYQKNPSLPGNRVLQQRRGESWIESRNAHAMSRRITKARFEGT